MKNKIKGFIFDLDGTLTLTQQLHYLALREVFSRYGIKYTQKEDQEKFSGKGSKFTCEQVLKAAGKNPSPTDIEKCADQKKDLYNQIIASTKITPVPGIKTFLETAQQKGIRMIVATGNKLDAAKMLLDKAGIGKFFNKIISQSDVKNQKPAPDIFLLAANKLNLPPEECIVFEDSINGVTAAKAGHITCVALTTGSPAKALLKAGAALTISNYKDPRLKKLFN
jgi:beta-phosphoglucomutase